MASRFTKPMAVSWRRPGLKTPGQALVAAREYFAEEISGSVDFMRASRTHKPAES